MATNAATRNTELPAALQEQMEPLPALAELRSVSQEMRSRKINNGRSTSRTLVAWADRIDAALDTIGGEA